MIIRVFSPHGSKRIDIDEMESVKILFEKITKEFINFDFQISRIPNGNEPIHSSAKYIREIGLKHGDIIYLHTNHTASNGVEFDGHIIDTNSSQESSQSKIFRQENDIDKILSKMDGKIYRQRNEQYCRHGPSGKCIHCVPLEPYDEQYLEHCDPPIKFISFHAYLRKLSGGLDHGKFTSLDNINCKIRPGCKEHLPWPEGICTKCQPSAITLSVQRYRHIDNIMFENAALMNDFLDFWRRTGNQRIGILFGYYTTFDQAPLGIKAVVTAIYEPEQRSNSKSVELVNLESSFAKQGTFLSESVMTVADTLGLTPVGWIFTDLISDDSSAGTVKHYRGTVDTFFLTAQECITAAFLQNMFPNICNLSPDGHFGSKFVTVVVTGDSNKSIHFEGYQVSNQCMALVRDDILVPTRDAPELGYIRESTSSCYVPDVFCKQTDKYGNSVTTPGRPVPIEFFLVHMTAAFAKEENFSFTQRPLKIVRFPIENRSSMGERQNKDTLARYMSQFTESEVSDAVANVHLLWYLHCCTDIVARRKHVLGLCVALSLGVNVRDGHEARSRTIELTRAVEKLKSSPEWQTVSKMLRKDGQTPKSVIKSPINGNGRIGGWKKVDGKSLVMDYDKMEEEEVDEKMKGSHSWSCQHCTYDNALPGRSCQICGLSRS